MALPVYWCGSEILHCESCNVNLVEIGKFIDGKICRGPWAVLCPACHTNSGIGLGTGRGQLYHKQPDGRWLKVEG